MRVASTVIFACVLLGAEVIHAQAFDATGTWDGGWTCRVQHNGTPVTFTKEAIVMKITQQGSTVYVDADNDKYHYGGWAGADTENAGRGAVTLVECRTSPTSTAFNEVISATVKASSRGGKLTGISAYSFIAPPDTDISGMCKLSFRRTSAADPGVGPCPPKAD